MNELPQGFPYETGTALWSAVTDKTKRIASQATPGQRRSALIQGLQREFIFGRFLARIFSDDATPWVLKGGSAMLLRVHDARSTKDIDLLHEIGDLQAAMVALERAASIDLRDHFFFQRSRTTRTMVTTGHDHIQGTRVTFDARCGVKNVGRIGVDLVTGSVMTGDPESVPAHPDLGIDGLVAPHIRIYPAPDHIADKVCATASTYRSGVSSRPRDLVDLVVFATTATLDSPSLRTAIQSEWAHRRLPNEPSFNPPEAWARPYAELAASIPACDEHATFDEAVALVGRFLAPALATPTAPPGRWNPQTCDWAPHP